MSTPETSWTGARNQLAQILTERIVAEGVHPLTAQVAANAVVRAFTKVRAGEQIIETTRLGDPTQTGIRMRYIDTRVLVGTAEEVVRGRTPGAEWTAKPVLLDVSRDPQQHPRDESGRYAAECREMPTRRCPRVYGGPCGDRPCARFESDDPTLWAAEAAETRRRYVQGGERG